MRVLTTLSLSFDTPRCIQLAKGRAGTRNSSVFAVPNAADAATTAPTAMTCGIQNT